MLKSHIYIRLLFFIPDSGEAALMFFFLLFLFFNQ